MKYICEVCGYVYDPAEGEEQLLRIFPMIGYAPSVA